MNQAETTLDPRPRLRGALRARRVWLVLFLVWALVLAFVPDPRPLGAPEWSVAAVRAASGISEPAARLIATLALRGVGFALLGALLMLAVGVRGWDRRSVATVLLSPLLAALLLWIDFGHFPIAMQITIAVASTVVGSVAVVALYRSPITAVSLFVALGAFFAWGTATGISDELDNAARTVARHVLASAHDVPDGDAGFERLLELAFHVADSHSSGADPVLANRAALLALSVIVGEERMADVARRHVDSTRAPEALALRERLTLLGRGDWLQHFWVSAGLNVLSDSDRSIAVGLAKELMDATPGGSGFSFSDLAADAAGNRLAFAATRDAESARALQARIRAGVRVADYFPDVRDLPEGLTREQFQERYGGIAGAGTRELVAEIERRLATCSGSR